MQRFDLTQNFIDGGHIPDAVFSAYAGHPVFVHRLDQFPHWQQMASGEPMPETAYNDRILSVLTALSKQRLWSYRKLSSLFNARDIANSRYTAIVPSLASINPRVRPNDYFDCVRRYGFDSDAAMTVVGKLPGRKQRYLVFPAHGREKLRFWDVRASRASLFLRDTTENARDFWTRLLNWPEDRVARHPDDGMHLLFADMHELRHLRHINVNSVLDQADAWCETDSDGFADHNLKQKNVGEATRAAMRHIRYYKMLKESPTYWIGPALDALDAGKEPPTFSDVYAATREIHIRLAFDYLDRPHRHLTSGDLQHALLTRTFSLANPCQDEMLLNDVKTAETVYAESISGLLSLKPEAVLTALREQVEGNVYTSPFVHGIAPRILAAAAFFNPELAHAGAPLRRENYAPSPAVNAAPTP